MTDLCDDPNAEKQCDMVRFFIDMQLEFAFVDIILFNYTLLKAIKNSVETDDQNPEAWQTKARLDLIRNNFEVS